MLIHRSLERIRRPSCASGESASSRGGTRVKCLLAVAAGVLACSAALFLLAQAYTAFYLSPVPFPPHEAKQPRANVSPPPLPKSVRESGQGQAAFKEKKTKLPPVQRVTDKIPAESGAIPAAATKQESEAAVLPEQSEQPHSSSSGYWKGADPAVRSLKTGSLSAHWTGRIVPRGAGGRIRRVWTVILLLRPGATSGFWNWSSGCARR